MSYIYMDDYLQSYLQQLERDISQKTAEIAQHQKNAEDLLYQASQVENEQDGKTVAVSTASERAQKPRYQSKIEQLAAKLGELGVEPEAVAGLSENAELSYLRQRVQTLQKTQNQMQIDYYNALTDYKQAKEKYLVAEYQKQHFEQLTNKYKQKNDQYSKQIAQLQQQKQDLQEQQKALQQNQDKSSKSQQKADYQKDVVQKRLQQAIEQIASLKEQLELSLAREKELRGYLSGGDKDMYARLYRSEREKDELLGILKKQQSLIDVLQRQKLHLQGAIRLGFREEEFQKIIE